MKTQYALLERLLTRKTGATAMEIVAAIGTVCPHKRLSEMKERGWHITRQQVDGKSYGRYFGRKPA